MKGSPRGNRNTHTCAEGAGVGGNPFGVLVLLFILGLD